MGTEAVGESEDQSFEQGPKREAMRGRVASVAVVVEDEVSDADRQ